MQYTDCTVHNAFNALSVACVCAILSFPSWKRGKKIHIFKSHIEFLCIKAVIVTILGICLLFLLNFVAFCYFQMRFAYVCKCFVCHRFKLHRRKKNKTNLQHDSWLGWLFFFFQFLNTVCLQNPHRNGMTQILNGELLHSIKPSFI